MPEIDSNTRAQIQAAFAAVLVVIGVSLAPMHGSVPVVGRREAIGPFACPGEPVSYPIPRVLVGATPSPSGQGHREAAGARAEPPLLPASLRLGQTPSGRMTVEGRVISVPASPNGGAPSMGWSFVSETARPSGVASLGLSMKPWRWSPRCSAAIASASPRS